MLAIKNFLCCGLMGCFLFFSACDDSSSTTIIAFGESSSSETILSSSIESSSSLITSSSSEDGISSSSTTNYCVASIDYSMVDSADVVELNSGTENFATQWAYFDSLFVEHQKELRQIDVIAPNFGSCTGTRYWITNGVVDSLQDLSYGSATAGTGSHPLIEIFDLIKDESYCGVAGDTAELCFSIHGVMDPNTGMPLHVWLNNENVPDYLAIDGGFNKYFRNAIWE
jgi:hypothetical protein